MPYGRYRTRNHLIRLFRETTMTPFRGSYPSVLPLIDREDPRRSCAPQRGVHRQNGTRSHAGHDRVSPRSVKRRGHLSPASRRQRMCFATETGPPRYSRFWPGRKGAPRMDGLEWTKEVHDGRRSVRVGKQRRGACDRQHATGGIGQSQQHASRRAPVRQARRRQSRRLDQEPPRCYTATDRRR